MPVECVGNLRQNIAGCKTGHSISPKYIGLPFLCEPKTVNEGGCDCSVQILFYHR
jgi:hypothetical protein